MKNFLWIGAIVIVFAILPVIFSDRQVDLYDTYKSYGLHPTAGVILFVAGILLMLQPNFRRLLLIALIGISVSTQVLCTFLSEDPGYPPEFGYDYQTINEMLCKS